MQDNSNAQREFTPNVKDVRVINSTEVKIANILSDTITPRLFYYIV